MAEEQLVDLEPITAIRRSGAQVSLEFVSEGEGEVVIAKLTTYYPRQDHREIREQRVYPDKFPRNWRNTAQRRMLTQEADQMTPHTLITEHQH